MTCKPAAFEVRRARVEGVTVVAACTAQAFARHTHDEFGIGLIDDGAQRSASGRGPVEATAGAVITVNPNEVHDGIPINQAPRAWRMLYIAPALVTEAARHAYQGVRAGAEFSAPVITRPGTADAFNALHAVASSAEPAAMAHFEERLLTVIADLFEVRDPVPALPAAILQVRQRIDSDPGDTATLEDWAREAGLSRFALVRAFTRHTGLPPHAYRVQKRIHLARRLLLSGRSPADVAAECGFADQSHLTRALTRAYGLPPGALASAKRGAQERSRLRGPAPSS